jgi:hypothetical protein
MTPLSAYPPYGLSVFWVSVNQSLTADYPRVRNGCSVNTRLIDAMTLQRGSVQPLWDAYHRGAGALTRVERGSPGAALGFLCGLGFGPGLSLKACLPNHLGMVLDLTFEFLTYGFVVYVPAIVVGFVIGFFTPLKPLPIVAASLPLPSGSALP